VERIYMDHSATTPMSPEVGTEMRRVWAGVYGNSESSHAFGQAAAEALERARETVSSVLRCRPSEITFTGSGTEADNLAIRGVAYAAMQAGRGRHIISNGAEHPAVNTTVEQLHSVFGFKVSLVPVDGCGRVDPEQVESAIQPDTVLVSAMVANNEVGTIQNVRRLGRICRERGVLFHTDAVQAAGRLMLQADHTNADLMAISAHKFYGPKGVGVLYVRRGTKLTPPITGGGHEFGRRPGTVDVAAAVGLAAALELAEKDKADENARLETLRDQIIEGVLASVPGSRLTGHRRERLPHHASFAFQDVEGEEIVLSLDIAGIATSSGSACAEGEAAPSSVLAAMGLDPSWSIGGLRITLGRCNSEEDVGKLLEVLPHIIWKLRNR
jgi:cysteine desulfurase